MRGDDSGGNGRLSSGLAATLPCILIGRDGAPKRAHVQVYHIYGVLVARIELRNPLTLEQVTAGAGSIGRQAREHMCFSCANMRTGDRTLTIGVCFTANKCSTKSCDDVRNILRKKT